MNAYEKNIIDRDVLLYVNGLHETLDIKNPIAYSHIYTSGVFNALFFNVDNIKIVMYDYYDLGIYPEIKE